ncbi:hypothetical protein FB45DRAFT_1116565 [Roridomyces roridus]|uniref:Uncharacterized protein n=1 Tax=Roridomyces roridus TaxID=1738132 RepID=A0AAD7FVD6_9AGAR|nr:hypothetical protein FB45DRAFT_1116565 [Roridomyces roridus]
MVDWESERRSIRVELWVSMSVIPLHFQPYLLAEPSCKLTLGQSSGVETVKGSEKWQHSITFSMYTRVVNDDFSEATSDVPREPTGHEDLFALGTALEDLMERLGGHALPSLQPTELPFFHETATASESRNAVGIDLVTRFRHIHQTGFELWIMDSHKGQALGTFRTIENGGRKAKAWLKDKLVGSKFAHRNINRDGVNLTMLGAIMRGMQYDARAMGALDLHSSFGIYSRDQASTHFRRHQRSVNRHVVVQTRIVAQNVVESTPSVVENPPSLSLPTNNVNFVNAASARPAAGRLLFSTTPLPLSKNPRLSPEVSWLDEQMSTADETFSFAPPFEPMMEDLQLMYSEPSDTLSGHFAAQDNGIRSHLALPPSRMFAWRRSHGWVWARHPLKPLSRVVEQEGLIERREPNTILRTPVSLTSCRVAQQRRLEGMRGWMCRARRAHRVFPRHCEVKKERRGGSGGTTALARSIHEDGVGGGRTRRDTTATAQLAVNLIKLGLGPLWKGGLIGEVPTYYGLGCIIEIFNEEEQDHLLSTWDSSEWILNQKIFHDQVPVVVQAARAQLLKVPASFTPYLPHKTLPISQLLTFHLPPIMPPDSSRMDDDSESLSAEEPIKNIEELLPELIVSMREEIGSLLKELDQAWFDGKKSFQTFSNPGLALPFLDSDLYLVPTSAILGRTLSRNPDTILGGGWDQSPDKIFETPKLGI